jgi:opacity protein-like surface antigen
MTQARLVSLAGRMLAVAALATTGGALLHAQAVQGGSAAAAIRTAAQSAAEQAPRLNLQLPAADVPGEAAVSSSSSSIDSLSSLDSSAGTEVAANTTDHFNFMNAMQYGGGRQRYGRPRYRGGNTNADGSAKYDVFVGGGFGIPAGTQSNYLTTSWGFQVGGGRNFNKNFGTNLEFDYDHFGMTGTTINNQQSLYNYYINLFCSTDPIDCANDGVTTISGLDANSHVWSLSLNPIYNLRSGEGIGAYITGGVGYYHKVANFTVPEVGCDPYALEFYGICEQIQENAVFDHYTSNAPGFNGGVGVTYKFSKFATERFYAEVRYVYVINSARPGVTLATATPNNINVANDFPANSNRTSYLPVKVGIRF